MAFIKNLTERLLADEFRPIANFYDSRAIGDDTEYLGFIKQTGIIAYGVVIINADRKYDYMGFYKEVLNFFSRLERVIVLGIFVSENPSEELISFCTNDIEDYQAPLVSIKWTADTKNSRLVVKGSQPDELLNIHKLVKASFSQDYSPSSDIETLSRKQSEIKASYIRSRKFPITLALIVINGIILIAMELCGGSRDTDVLLQFGALEHELIFGEGQIYRIFTHMFLHIGLMHYLANSLSLYIMGSRVERYYGSLKMLAIYIFSGLLCGTLSGLLSHSVSAGASGAIFGLMAAVLVYTRVTGRSMDGFDNYLMAVFAIIGIGSGMLMANVDNIGHIGGFIGGLIAGRLLLTGDKNE